MILVSVFQPEEFHNPVSQSWLNYAALQGLGSLQKETQKLLAVAADENLCDGVSVEDAAPSLDKQWFVVVSE